jgi:DNA-binding transcriptional ArsR family regulator
MSEVEQALEELAAAGSDEERVEIERRLVEDTAEEDPGIVDDAD